MSKCCDDNCAIDALRERQRGTLRIVFCINGVMFLVIMVAALYGKSTALLADSLDNLGDAFMVVVTFFDSSHFISHGRNSCSNLTTSSAWASTKRRSYATPLFAVDHGDC